MFYEARLYADVTLQIFILASIYGRLKWLHGAAFSVNAIVVLRKWRNLALANKAVARV